MAAGNTASRDPARPIRRTSATRHDAVHVRMMGERLAPRVQNGGEADLGAKMLVDSRKFRTGSKPGQDGVGGTRLGYQSSAPIAAHPAAELVPIVQPGYSLPERVLSKFFSDLAPLAAQRAFSAYLAPLWKIDWVVDCKQPFAGPEQVLRYLIRYTHRVAISDHRLVEVADAHVTFRWKDYSDGSRIKHMTLAPAEFIRRFLLHVLPAVASEFRQHARQDLEPQVFVVAQSIGARAVG
jgi:Putative transposase